MPKSDTFQLDIAKETSQLADRVGEQDDKIKGDDFQAIPVAKTSQLEEPIITKLETLNVTPMPLEISPEPVTLRPSIPTSKPPAKPAPKRNTKPIRKTKRADRVKNERAIKRAIKKLEKAGKRVTNVAIAAETDISRKTVIDIRKTLKS